MKGFVLRPGEGRRYNWYGYDFTVKAGHPETLGAAGFMEFATKKGEEPSDHVHAGEDEIFIMLDGEMTVRCGTDTFEVGVGDFVFSPRDVPHGLWCVPIASGYSS